MNIEQSIKNEISKYIQDSKYIKFQSKICKTKRNIIGVKIPNLRKIAKNFSNNTSYDINEKNNYIEDTNQSYSFEEILIKGFMIEYVKEFSLFQRFDLLKKYISCIDSWAICDSLCSSLKFINKNKKETFEFLEDYFKSDKEFLQRFAIVITLNYYIDDIYIDSVLEKYKIVKSNDYYSKMAIAWALSKIYVIYPEKTINYIDKYIKDDFIYNMSLQKIIESYKVCKKDKEKLKKMKKNKK